jgi:hypothetical protein
MSEWTGLRLGQPRCPLAPLDSTPTKRLKAMLSDLDLL